MQKFKFYSGKLVPLFLTLLFLTLLSSCDQEEAIVGEEVTTPLFGKLQLKKDASGAYSIDLETVNITSEVYENEYEKTVNIDLYPSHQVNREKVTEDIFETNESEFSIYLNNKLDGKMSKISIFDQDFKFLKEDSSDDYYLASYSFTDNGDETYTLEFSVVSGTEVDFSQDQVTGEYEIHLTPGNGSQSDYSATFNKEVGLPLVIGFKNYSSESRNNRTTSPSSNDKPRVIVDTEVDE